MMWMRSGSSLETDPRQDSDGAAWPALVGRRIRRAAGGGAPLSGALRHRLEAGLGADLGALRIHADDEAAELATLLKADAFTVGSDLFFRSGAYNPATAAGLYLLAHEAAHAVQQAVAPRRRGTREIVITRPGDAAERAADHAAARLLRGQAAGRAAPRVAVRRLEDRDPLVIQRHASWEHRLLGDAPPADLASLAQQLPNRTQLLSELRDFLWMWSQNPEGVSEEMIQAKYPYIRTLRLKTSGLLVTYGELNTLPDYMASADVLEQQPKAILLPILQAVRQEGYNRVQRLLGESSVGNFAGAVSKNTGWDFVDLLVETRALDSLTANIGPRQTNHYTALVGRNACHFAPFSWYRWEQSYLLASATAARAYAERDPNEKERLTYLAWMYHGYADHFLHDSFAAGHLVNKTLIMQWFVEWATGQPFVPIADWERVKTMTTELQPGLAARDLYAPLQPGVVRDPQTAEERATIQGRMNIAGVRADRSTSATQTTAYQNYLAFLDDTTIQSASGVLHDHFNGESLWVASAAITTPFQLWGDDTMLNGGDGVRIAGETAHLSQQSIAELLAGGTTSVTMQSIRDRFPTLVRADQGKLLGLGDWNVSLKRLTFELFPSVHYDALRVLAPRIGSISVDAAGFSVWHDALPGFAPEDHATDIGIGANGATYFIRAGATPDTEKAGIYSLDNGGVPQPPVDQRPSEKSFAGEGFPGVCGGSIAVGPDGTAWALNADGTVLQRVGAGSDATWQPVAGDGATDIGVGANGAVWIIGRNAVGDGNYGIWMRDGDAWRPVDGGAVRISVGPDGLPWAVDAAGTILRRVGSPPMGVDWDRMPGQATDIAVGANGAVWIVGRNAVGDGNYGIWHWSDRDFDWVPVDGGGVRIAAGPGGVPWAITAAGKIVRWNLGESPAQPMPAVPPPDLGPSDLLPPGDDPFVLSKPQFLAVQTYVDAGTRLPASREDMQTKLGIAGDDVDQFGDLIGAYKSVSDHCAYFKTVTFPMSVGLASDIVAYNVKVPVYYGALDSVISQWRNGSLPEDKAKAKFGLVLKNLRDQAKVYAGNAGTVKQKVADFFEETKADRGYLMSVRERYVQRYEGREGEINTFMDQIRNDQDSIRLWNEEYQYDVVVAATTPTYAWVWPVGTIAAAIVAGVYGTKATEALKQVREYQEKLAQAEEGLRRALTLMHDLDLANRSIDGILASLNAALPVLAKMEGIWVLIADQLTNIVDQIIDKDIDQAALMVKDLGVAEAIAAWAKVAALADNYRANAYITVTVEDKVMQAA